MKRIVGAIAVLSCVLAIAVLLWVRVRARQDSLSVGWDSGHGKDIGVRAYVYGLDCTWSTYEPQTSGWLDPDQPPWPDELSRFEFRSDRVADGWEGAGGVQDWVVCRGPTKPPLHTVLGVGFNRSGDSWFIRAPGKGGIHEWTGRSLPLRMGFTHECIIPYWLPIALLSIAPLRALARRVRTFCRGRPGACTGCGYDRRASPDRCPECGSTSPPATHRSVLRAFAPAIAATTLLVAAGASAAWTNHLARIPIPGLPIAKEGAQFRPEFIGASGAGLNRMRVTQAYGTPAHWDQAIWQHDGQEFLVVFRQEIHGDALFSSYQLHVSVFDHAGRIIGEDDTTDGTPYALYEVRTNDPKRGPGPWKLGVGVWWGEQKPYDPDKPIRAEVYGAHDSSDDPPYPADEQCVDVFEITLHHEARAQDEDSKEVDPFDAGDVPIEIRSAEPNGPRP